MHDALLGPAHRQRTLHSMITVKELNVSARERTEVHLVLYSSFQCDNTHREELCSLLSFSLSLSRIVFNFVRDYYGTITAISIYKARDNSRRAIAKMKLCLAVIYLLPLLLVAVSLPRLSRRREILA